MKKHDNTWDYLSPEIEVLEMVVEQGFALSQLENPDEELGEW